jgi:hypothetical protein
MAGSQLKFSLYYSISSTTLQSSFLQGLVHIIVVEALVIGSPT